MHRCYTIDKKDKKALNPKLVGAKAARLALMHRHDFPVPDFVVISTRAYEAFYNRGQKSCQKIADILKDVPLVQSGASLAVRSSAPFEDQYGYSMAGMFETFLDVQEIDNIVSAIRNCWASLHSNIVQNYLEQFSLSPRDRKIAVILQKMIRADFAGVLFTKHPVTHSDTIVIEAVPGIGEKLVSGQIEPIRMTVDKRLVKSDPEILRAVAHCSDHSVLSWAMLQRLIELALQVEALFGAPQDIEWAIEGDSIWILQARPISTGVGHYSHFTDECGHIWSNYFFVERFNKPLSPLGWTLLRDLIERNAFREPLWYLGEEEIATQPRLTRLKNGVPYTKLAVFQKLYKLVPRQFISEDKKRSLLLDSKVHHWLGQFLKTLPYLMARLIFYDLNWFPPTHLRNWYKFEKTIDWRLTHLRRRLDGAHDLSTLENVFNALEQLSNYFLSLHRWSITFADIFYALLRSVLHKLFGSDMRPSRVDELLSGFAENETLRANLMLAEMASLQSQHRCVDDIMSEFMHRFGHRSESLDILEPTWRDMPQIISRIIQQIGESGKAENILEDRQSKINMRINAEKEVFASIAQFNKLQRIFYSGLFKTILHYAQQFALLRENQRNVWQKILALTRSTAIRIGQMAAAENVLMDENDIFFLTKSEVYDFLKGRLRADGSITRAIHARKRRWLNSLKRHEKNEDQLVNETNHQEIMLEGIGVSSGKASGIAKLASTFSEAIRVSHGQILVAHSADPGWTPLFGVISGLVLEVGGVLSHASIVAREFGLPAVTSVPEAMKMIHEGDMIEVDGEQGTVHILKKVS